MIHLIVICHRASRTYDLVVLFVQKSFEELIELASKGNDENVTVLGKQLKSNDGFDVYAQMPDDLVLYCFGQAVGRNLGG